MEKPKDTSKQEKKKMVIRVSGGGVGGVLVWGAAVAIATLVSVSALKFLRNKRPPNKTNHDPPPPPQAMPSTINASNKLELNNHLSDDDQGKGLILLLQDNSSAPPDYHPSGDGIKDVSVDSTPLDSNKSLISDVDAMLDISRLKEKPHYLDSLLGDDPKPKNSSLETCDYGDKQQEYSLVVEEKVLQSDQFEEQHSQIPFGKGGEEEEEEIGGEIVKEVTETFQIVPFSIEFNLEGFEVRAPDAPQIEVEDSIKMMQLIGKEAAEEEEQDDITETVKEVTETNQKDQFAVEFNTEEIQVMKEDEVIGGPDSPQTEAEDHPQMQMVEEEQEIGENIVEMVVEVVKTAQKDQFAVELYPEPIPVMEEEKAIDSTRIEAEDNPETQLIGEEKEHDHGERDETVGKIEDNPLLKEEEEEENSDEVDEEETAEKGEESSEETGDSSMESNAEAIWPVESIEELSQQLKLKEESKTNIQKQEESITECRAVGKADPVCFASIKNQGIYANGNYKNDDTRKSRISPMKDLLMRINVSMDTSNTRIWLSSVAALLLIVVAPLLLSFANIVKLCVIVFLLVILSHIWELP
ncbi:hypothetical protein Vadar_033452 [Vaccinium darrowii]|uniref:Uncharacterized protein n=1 Tax=Vaccinium darrowii TaxID=229202 RepID=A0ACB7ZH25_9ERIC|nr:hypothetical protein Vadar_033452 [Vaccinium darrowii]